MGRSIPINKPGGDQCQPVGTVQIYCRTDANALADADGKMVGRNGYKYSVMFASLLVPGKGIVPGLHLLLGSSKEGQSDRGHTER